VARYLITGVAGFIGSWLAHELVARGEQVRGLDNLSSGSLANLADIEDKIEFQHGDLRNVADVARACEGVDFIFHEAAIASVQLSIDDPLGTHATNVLGTLHLIAEAKKHGVRRIVFAASSAAYGDQQQLPLKETLAPRPLSPYAVQKLTCEYLLRNAWLLDGLETVSLRYFNVFGPRQNASSPYSGAIARFAAQMLRETDHAPVIFGDGKQARDFVYISDVVDANMLAMHASPEKVAGEVFNIGTGCEQTISETFRVLAEITSYSGEVQHAPARKGDIRSSVADIHDAHKAFDYAPRISFREGLERTAVWYREDLGGSIPARLRSASSKQIATHNEPQNIIRGDVKEKLSLAFENGEMRVVYQPILSLATGQISGAEALIRWQRGHELLSAVKFIHIAEQSNLILTLGEWVLQQACQQAVLLQKHAQKDFRIAVNVSPRQLEKEEFVQIVKNSLTQSGLPPQSLDLEITERILMRDSTSTHANLRRLRDTGVHLAIDDFGIGYSNMNYLYRFPIERLKIDQSFIQHANSRVKVLEAIVSFAKKLEIPTVAEGVETARQFAHVKNSQCDEVQGHFVARPMLADAFLEFFHIWQAHGGELTHAVG